MSIKWLIPTLGSKEENTKASILVYIFLFSNVLLIILFLANEIFKINSSFPFSIFIITFAFLLLLFRMTGSFVLVGNLLAGSLSIAMISLTFRSGGIFSEDTHSIFLVPLLAFLTAGIRSGIAWFFIVTAWVIYLYTQAGTGQEIAYFRNQTLQYNKDYYLVFALFNLVIVCVTLGIFRLQYQKIFKRLEKNKTDLETQKDILQKTQVELENSNKELDQYAHTTAHDLKQPIRTINSFSGLLEKELKKSNPSSKKIEEYIDIIKGGSSNMNQLVTDLLAYSQLSNTKANTKSTVRLKQVMDVVKGNLKNLIDTNKAAVVSNNLPKVNGMEIQLIQLFQNLISNAIKFKHHERRSEIFISSEELDTSYKFSIADNGIGIKQANLDSIFRPFKKLHSSKEYEGSGIGLATCKKIVEMHNGEIWVESKEGTGTTFFFTIKK